MRQICFATNNPNKLREVSEALRGHFEVLGLNQIGCNDELPETSETLEGNSLQKAKYIHDHFSIDCFADDTGLEIDALNGAPGVYSARYAGPACLAEDNMAKVLEKMEGLSNRSARFRTIITLILNGKTHQFEGQVNGIITETRSGAEGFGYDPIFQPAGYDITFAEMSMQDKNAISHRGQAVALLLDHLKGTNS